MVIMGGGICHWFHGDVIYRSVLALLMLTGRWDATAAAGLITSVRKRCVR